MGHALDMETATRAMLFGSFDGDDGGGHPVAQPQRKRGPHKRRARSHRPWSPEEDRVLAREWGEVCPRVLRSKITGRSWEAIYNRATKVLRLPYGLPQGTVSLKEAARRLGCSSVKSVRALARRQHVPIRLHPHPPTLGTKVHAWSCVDWEDVREAYLHEANTTETITGGAARHGLIDVTLARWLRRAGVIGDRKTHGAPVRVLTADVDRVVAAHRSAA